MKQIMMMVTGMLLLSSLVSGQTKTGTTIGQFLLIEPSSRSAGMGNVGAAAYDELLSAYYNPAAIGRLPGSGLAFTHSMWLANITYNYAAGALQLGEIGNLYCSVTSLNSGDIDVRTVDQPLGTGERYTVSDFAAGIGYGREVSDRFSVGLQVNYVQETIWHSSYSAIALSVGTIYRIAANGLHIGASISNFGTRAKYSGDDLRIQFDQNPAVYGDNSALPAELFMDEYSLPVFFRVGVSLPYTIDEKSRLTVAADAYHPNDNTESVSFGLEYLFHNTLALRGGYQNLFQQDRENGLTLGAGILYDMEGYDLRFDYSWADYGRLENVQRFSLGVTF